MMVETRTLVRRVRYRAVLFASTKPRLYYGLRRLTGTLDHQCVAGDTELVIEGYPRSANSTTVYEFQARQPQPVRLAHHKHHAAQLLLAAERRIPAVMLIRSPRDAALSNLALLEEARQRSGHRRKPHLRYSDVIESWLAFYKATSGLENHFIVAPFDNVTRDISWMIEAINEKFGTGFSVAQKAGSTTKPLGWHARPNTLRDGIKRELEQGFSAALEQSEKLRRDLDAANQLYQHFLQIHASRR